ncbi:MAG: PDZ domain-containing protein [Candidatus Sulfotelmatobacter sp.]
MRFPLIFISLVLVVSSAFAQEAATPRPEPKFVTVPITLDHNRVIIDVYVPLPDGSTKRVRGWVDTGDSDLWMSQRVADLMGLSIRCDAQVCAGKPASSSTMIELRVGGMKISGAAISEARVPAGDGPIAPGMSAEIKIPSTILRGYDVLINFPDREFSIGQPGSLSFEGVKSKMLVDASTGFIQIPSKIEKKSCNLGLDVGSSISFLSEELFEKLASEHPDWAHMTGAVGPANMGEAGDDEAKWKLMRVDRVQYGPLFLTDVAVAEFPKTFSAFFEKEAGGSIPGLLGANALMNYRIGLDYAHSLVYFDIGRTFKFPDFDVIGLVLRSDDTRFTIVGVADFEGKPSVPEVQAGDHLIAVDEVPVLDSTLGQVWSLLEGSPGQERKLTVERAGKQFTVAAKVQHFLGETEESQSKEKSGKKK